MLKESTVQLCVCVYVKLRLYCEGIWVVEVQAAHILDLVMRWM
jgi:hypothetical protein